LSPDVRLARCSTVIGLAAGGSEPVLAKDCQKFAKLRLG
jgi:hypothetical protein